MCPTGSRRPEDPRGEAQPAPEPAADRGDEGHHADGLGQRQQHAEGEQEVPGLPDQPQQDHTAPVQQAARQHEVPRPIPLTQPKSPWGSRSGATIIPADWLMALPITWTTTRIPTITQL